MNADNKVIYGLKTPNMSVDYNKCRYLDVVTLKYIFPRKGP